MKVLVGIVCKNRASILPKAIDSALNQDIPDVAIAVYDDNSSDDTYLLKEKYPTVDWEFGKENKGYVYARNKFMSSPGAVYFCSLDDDSWFLKRDSLGIAVRYLDEHPGVAAVAFDILSPDRPTEVKEGTPVEVSSFIGCGHLLRLSCVRGVGFYDPFPSFYGGEEKDLCIRLIDKGYRVMLLPGIHVWHDKTQVARNMAAQHRSGICNDLVFAWRRTPFVFLIPVMFFKLISHVWFGARYERGRLLRAALTGIMDFFKVLFKGNITRKPVSAAAMKEFRLLNKRT